jgi:hypothetical protein
MANSADGGCPIRKIIRKNKDNPLIIAYVDNQDKESAWEIIRSGECKYLHKTILREAAKKNDLDTVQFLLRGNFADAYDNLAFLKACERGFEDIVDEFLAHGSEINKHNKSGAYYASLNGHYNIVLKWLELGFTDFHTIRTSCTVKNIYDFIITKFGYLAFMSPTSSPKLLSIHFKSTDQEYGAIKLLENDFSLTEQSITSAARCGAFTLLNTLLNNSTLSGPCEQYATEFDYNKFLRTHKLTPAKAIKLLDEKNYWHVALFPKFLASYLKKGKKSPLSYLATCPDWQKEHVLKNII